jgi:hypothetical protein
MSTTHSISLEQAAEMTSRFRSNRNTILSEEYRDGDIIANCETFDREAIEDVIEQEGCTRFRIYYGMDEELKIHAILVGVNDNDADILPEGNEVLREEGQRCPPYCPISSPLNQDE